MHMIILDDVTKTYPNRSRPAIDHLSLHIEPKEFVFLIGKSGAGKSTLIKLLTREIMPDSGRIIVGGIDYSQLKRRHIPYLRRRIGVVFQDYKLLPGRTVFENVAFALEIVGASNHEIKRNVPKVLELVGLADKGDEFPDNLSGGERQRVSIARSMVRQPKILVADEPTGNLDPDIGLDIVNLLEEINRYGTTVLVTTHDEKVVNRLKRRVITLEHGRLIGDQKDGGRYDLEAMSSKIIKHPLSATAAASTKTPPRMARLANTYAAGSNNPRPAPKPRFSNTMTASRRSPAPTRRRATTSPSSRTKNTKLKRV